MPYKIYFNPIWNLVRIHRYECTEAGQGFKHGESGANSLWTTPIATMAEARVLARRLVNSRRKPESLIEEHDCIAVAATH